MVKKIAVLIIVIVIGGTCAYWLWPQTDMGMIKGQFRRLSEYASKLPGEGASSALWKTQGLSNLFEDTCSLEVDNAFLTGDYTKEEISSKAFAVRRRFSKAVISFHDLSIDIIKPNEAKAVFTASLDATNKSGESIFETREMQAILKKTDGTWLFSEFKLINILKK